MDELRNSALHCRRLNCALRWCRNEKKNHTRTANPASSLQIAQLNSLWKTIARQTPIERALMTQSKKANQRAAFTGPWLTRVNGLCFLDYISCNDKAVRLVTAEQDLRPYKALIYGWLTKQTTLVLRDQGKNECSLSENFFQWSLWFVLIGLHFPFS